MLTAGDLLWNPPTEFRPTENDWFNDVAVQADGKIVAVGYALVGPDSDFLVARFTAGGKLDLSFGGGDGWLTHDFSGGRNDDAQGVVIQADGKLVVGGTTTLSSDDSFGLIRLNVDGSLDSSYGVSGRAVENYATGDIYLQGLARTADDGVIAVGSKYEDGADERIGTVYKFNSAGTKDVGFNGNGFRDLTSSVLADVAVDPLGRVVVVSSYGHVTRLTSVGAVDGTFSDDGMTLISYDVGTYTIAETLAVMPDGRIVVAGNSSDGGNVPLPGVARLNENGSYDNTFAGNGRYSFDVVAGTWDFITDVAVLPNGGVVAAGSSGNFDIFVAVLTPAGVLDGGFSGDGLAVADFGANDSAAGLAVTPAGHYVVVGWNTRPGIVQFEGRYGRKDDLAGWTNAGQWWVAASSGASFVTGYYGAWDAGLAWKYVSTGDFNGDGRADMAGRDGFGRWWVGINTGTAFATSRWKTWSEGAGWRDERFADFNGDGKTDVAGRTSAGQWWVMLSTPAGTGFTAPAAWAAWSEGLNWQNVLAADVNGDGKTDLVGRAANGQWWVARSTGATFVTQPWGFWSGPTWNDVLAGDFDGDGRVDIAGRTAGGQWWVARSTGTAFANVLYTTWSDAGWRDVSVGDFNGDGRADIVGRTSTGQWWVARSTGTAFTNALWDTWSEGANWRDVRVGDFDGDGKSDIAGRTSGGQWWVSKSNGTRFTNSLWATWSEPAGWRTFRGEFKPTLT